MSKLTIKQQKFADEYIISGNVYGLVYKITNLINEKIYIGVTTRKIELRFEEHCKSNSALGRAIKKYGRENFKKEIIDFADSYDELMALEVENIKKYNSYILGYNQTLGGDGVIFYQDLEINLNHKQKEFIKLVKAENKKTLEVNNDDQMLRMFLMNLIDIYLNSTKRPDKISISKLILKLRPNLLQVILDTDLVNLKELRHYSSQKVSSFEVYNI